MFSPPNLRHYLFHLQNEGTRKIKPTCHKNIFSYCCFQSPKQKLFGFCEFLSQKFHQNLSYKKSSCFQAKQTKKIYYSQPFSPCFLTPTQAVFNPTARTVCSWSSPWSTGPASPEKFRGSWLPAPAASVNKKRELESVLLNKPHLGWYKKWVQINWNSTFQSFLNLIPCMLGRKSFWMTIWKIWSFFYRPSQRIADDCGLSRCPATQCPSQRMENSYVN